MRKRNAEQAARVAKTAEITGVTTRQVRNVINGAYNNELVFSTYMFLAEGENQLVKAARELVPIDGPSKNRRGKSAFATP